MMIRKLVLSALVTIMLAAFLPARLEANGPSYLILRSPSHVRQGSQQRGYYPSQGYGVSTQTYSYGWFGTSRRRHGSKHHGYYGRRIQWSFR